MLKIALALALGLGVVNAECPNACSGHGDCTNYDQCHCNRNWESADCSERTCPFGLAHVDSPRGDLDSSADSLSGPGTTILLGSTKYPLGVQEQFPNMTDSSGNMLTQTAHYYMECSNKGICDRKGGECECFDGYEGSSCQRASCPNECSGHGTCEHIKTLAANDFDNMYDLWDAEVTMGCACDAGYSGPDCSGKNCKYGIDPLYVDDASTARVEAVTYKFGVTANLGAIEGTYALKFYDAFGEDYQTAPIRQDADCYTVEDALDGLPNTVIPDDSIVCTKATSGTGATEVISYSLTFRGNPGYLKQLFVDTYLSEHRATLGQTDAADGGSVWTKVFNEGMTGEFTDYFATQCQNVYARVEALGANFDGSDSTKFPELNSGWGLNLDTVETKLLKQCLGDSDGFVDDNVEVYDWDYGSVPGSNGVLMMSSYPHAIKLVQVDPYDDWQGGMYYLTWWESVNKKFVLANFPTAAYSGTSTEFAVFVTDGVVERVIVDLDTVQGKTQSQYEGNSANDAAEIEYGDAGIGELEGTLKNVDERVTAYFTEASNILYTSYDTACETAFFAVEPCLDKGDMLFVIDSNYLNDDFNPALTHSASYSGGAAVYGTGNEATYESGNIYTIQKIYKEDPTEASFAREDRYRIILDKNIPFKGTNTGVSNTFNTKRTTNNTNIKTNQGIVNLFKFSPATTGNYDFVAPCSNRGTCDEGACECFKGYTNDNCDVQSAIAL